ncbi:UDP-glucose 4-epimerase GalE [Desulfosarcina ovata]|uniref:UDP-glucose 4-epimerase n=1 Tax=Desulfosarcina ovata subsp. ovata TaxID=2752305 RepID=A0A5K8A319_9BACT|nr:UDP-glucose 4-epimerase GalE [Desulfosarcina ovata]BBO86887.1 UDP-glucose 4-epimerase GalE [Desulfosarcina ovata subsp. ovata]
MNPKKKSVLVVGGAGYIGSHMVRQLVEAKWNVVILDNLSTGSRQLVHGGQLVQGRLGDVGLLDQLFSDHDVAAVMHFAAFSQVGESVDQPLKYYRNNLAETINLLDAMVRHRVLRFIFSSTAAVYGEPEAIPITENHPRQPTNPYGNTKLAVERMLADCDAAFGLKYAALRYFNAAGADPSGEIGEMHDPETHLIPIVLKAASGHINNIQVFGTDYPTTDGTCIRDYVHVNDLAQAHLLALNALFDGGASAVYNLGSSSGYSVKEVIRIAERVTGKKIPVVEGPRRLGDPAVLVASSEKIKNRLGWVPVYDDLEKIIRTAWNWHLKQIS